MALTPNIWQNECYCRAVILIWWDFYTIYNNRVKRSTPNFAIWILRQALFRFCFRLLQPKHIHAPSSMFFILIFFSFPSFFIVCVCFAMSLQLKIVCEYQISCHSSENLKQIHLEMRFLCKSVVSVCHIFCRRFNSFRNVAVFFFAVRKWWCLMTCDTFHCFRKLLKAENIISLRSKYERLI